MSSCLLGKSHVALSQNKACRTDLLGDWQSRSHCPQSLLLVGNFCSAFFPLVFLIFSSFLPAPLPTLLTLAALGPQRSEVIYFLFYHVRLSPYHPRRDGGPASAGTLANPHRGAESGRPTAWKGLVCSGVGPPRQLLVSSVVVKNQEQSLSLVICSSSVTNFSSMGHLVCLWMMALVKWHHPDGGVNRSDAGTGSLDPACVFRERLKGPAMERNVQHACGTGPAGALFASWAPGAGARLLAGEWPCTHSLELEFTHAWNVNLL